MRMCPHLELQIMATRLMQSITSVYLPCNREVIPTVPLALIMPWTMISDILLRKRGPIR